MSYECPVKDLEFKFHYLLILQIQFTVAVDNVSNAFGLPGCSPGGPVRFLTRKPGVATGFRDGF